MIELIAERVNCVLRAGELSDSLLVGRRINTFQQVTCAIPDYFQRFGIPRTLDDLAHDKMVAYAASLSGQACPMEFMDSGKLVELSLSFDLMVSGADIETASGLAGLRLIQALR